MPAGGGDLERALAAFLAFDVKKKKSWPLRLADARLRARQHLRALEMIGELDEGGGGNDLHLRARPGGFRLEGR